MMKYLLAAILLMFSIIPQLCADEVTFTASSKEVVSVGDRFQLVYTVNTKVSDFSAPKIEHFRVLTGPNVSTSQNYQVINGKMSQSITLSYVYYLQAFEVGKFNIPPATIVVDGKEYKSNSLKVEVVKGNSNQSTPKNQGNTSNARATSNQNPTGDIGEDVYLKAYISNTNPYQGQQVIITYKIFTAGVPISDIDFQSMASFPGFWSTNLLEGEQITPKQEIINGREFTTGILFKAALFPQKSGEISIDPKELSCTAQIRVQGQKKSRGNVFDSFFDDPFFNNQFQNVRIEVKSNPITVNVKPLPIANKPAGYSGAVGKFNLRSSVDVTELSVNDAATLKMIISGSGNLELINTPDIHWPPDFETYDPKVSKNIKTTQSGVSGSRTFEYLAIPRSAGEFSVGPVEFSYFDPSIGQYKTLSTEVYNFDVEKGNQSSSNISYSGVAQEAIMYIGQEVRHIKTGYYTLHKTGVYFFGSNLFFILLAVPLILLIILVVIVSQNRKNRSNIALMKNKKATRVARKNLKKANELLKAQDREGFYAEVSRALWGYLSDKFNIPLSKLSIESVSDELSEKHVSLDSINKFIEVLNNCEYARFAPGESAELMHENYQESIQLISRIESELKN